jgi:hypothetical protein
VVSFHTLAVLVFGGVLLAIWAANEIRFFQVLMAALFGFYLADSGLAPMITEMVKTVFDWVGTWNI